MSFSRLLLVAANSKKYISGTGNDKVFVKPRSSIPFSGGDPYAGEVVLCFQLDEPGDKGKVARSLDLQEDNKRCDGLIFYAEDDKDDRVICLVEMKSTKVAEVAEQIKLTKDHIDELLRAECYPYCNKQLSQIKWKACFYHQGASPDDVTSVLRQLKKAKFTEVHYCTAANSDIGPFLRDEIRNTKKGSNKYKKIKRK
ncbi:MAG: hypothetical protein M3Y81_23710 [Chloroflexota bacterium]|nr:hypothetical protein [Chloroflexota bacterium]